MLDPASRSLFVDWTTVLEDIAGRLRVNAARHPDDPEIAAVVAALCSASPRFAETWERHPARERPLGGTRLDHPVLGKLHLKDTVLRSAEDEDQVIIVFHPEVGSPTERALLGWSARSGPQR